MGWLDRIGKVISGAVDIVKAPIGLAYDLVRSFPDPDLDIGDAFGVNLNQAAEGLGKISEGVGVTALGRGVTDRTPIDEFLGEAFRQLEGLYSSGYQEQTGQVPLGLGNLGLEPGQLSIQRVLATGAGFAGDVAQPVTGEGIPEFQTPGQYWRDARTMSPGEAWVMNRRNLFGLPPEEIEKIKATTAYQLESGLLDAAMRWKYQPEVMAARGYMRVRARWNPTFTSLIDRAQRKFGMDFTRPDYVVTDKANVDLPGTLRPHVQRFFDEATAEAERMGPQPTIAETYGLEQAAREIVPDTPEVLVRYETIRSRIEEQFGETRGIEPDEAVTPEGIVESVGILGGEDTRIVESWMDTLPEAEGNAWLEILDPLEQIDYDLLEVALGSDLSGLPPHIVPILGQKIRHALEGLRTDRTIGLPDIGPQTGMPRIPRGPEITPELIDRVVQELVDKARIVNGQIEFPTTTVGRGLDIPDLEWPDLAEYLRRIPAEELGLPTPEFGGAVNLQISGARGQSVYHVTRESAYNRMRDTGVLRIPEGADPLYRFSQEYQGFIQTMRRKFGKALDEVEDEPIVRMEGEPPEGALLEPPRDPEIEAHEIQEWMLPLGLDAQTLEFATMKDLTDFLGTLPNNLEGLSPGARKNLLASLLEIAEEIWGESLSEVTTASGGVVPPGIRSLEGTPRPDDRTIHLLGEGELPEAYRYAAALYAINPDDVPIILKINPEGLPVIYEDYMMPHMPDPRSGLPSDASLVTMVDRIGPDKITEVIRPTGSNLDVGAMGTVLREGGQIPDYLQPGGRVHEALFNPDGSPIEPGMVANFDEIKEVWDTATHLYNTKGETEAVKFIKAAQHQRQVQAGEIQDFPTWVMNQKETQQFLNRIDGKSADDIRRLAFWDIQDGGTISSMLAQATSYQEKWAILASSLGMVIPEQSLISPINRARIAALRKEMDELAIGPEALRVGRIGRHAAIDGSELSEQLPYDDVQMGELLTFYSSQINEAERLAQVGDWLTEIREFAPLGQVPHITRTARFRETVRQTAWYQEAGLARPLRAVVERRPHHFINVHDANAHVQIIRQMEEARTLGITADQTKGLVEEYMATTSEVQRIVVLEKMDRTIIRAAATKAGLSVEELDQLLSAATRGKRRTSQILRARRYAPEADMDLVTRIDEETGEIIQLALPLLGTQLQNWVPLTDVRALIRQSTEWRRMRTRFGAIPTEVLNSFYNLWKPTVLLRGGWPIRVVSDEQLRILARGGSLLQHLAGIEAGDMPRWGRVFDPGLTAAQRAASTYGLVSSIPVAATARVAALISRGSRKLGLVDPQYWADLQAAGYEKLASQRAAFAGPNEAINLEFEGMLGRFEAGIMDHLVSRGSGQWGSVDKNSPMFGQAWRRALQEQLGRDDLAKVLLEEIKAQGYDVTPTSAIMSRVLKGWQDETGLPLPKNKMQELADYLYNMPEESLTFDDAVARLQTFADYHKLDADIHNGGGEFGASLSDLASDLARDEGRNLGRWKKGEYNTPMTNAGTHHGGRTRVERGLQKLVNESGIPNDWAKFFDDPSNLDAFENFVDRVYEAYEHYEFGLSAIPERVVAADLDEWFQKEISGSPDQVMPQDNPYPWQVEMRFGPQGHEEIWLKMQQELGTEIDYEVVARIQEQAALAGLPDSMRRAADNAAAELGGQATTSPYGGVDWWEFTDEASAANFHDWFRETYTDLLETNNIFLDAQIQQGHPNQFLRSLQRWETEPGDFMEQIQSSIRRWLPNNPRFQSRSLTGVSDRALDWFLTPEGQTYMEKLPWRGDNPTLWIDDVLEMMDSLTAHFDPRLVDAVLSGKVPRGLLEKIDEASRPPTIHGEVIDQGLGNSAISKFLNEFFSTGFDLMGRLPTDTLSRQPFFREMYAAEMRRLRNLNEAQGIVLTERNLNRMNGQSRRFALHEVNRWLYNLAEESRFGSMMRWWTPFFNAWQEVIGVWLGLARHDPQVIGRGLLIWRAPEKMGLIEHDSEGNEFITFRLSERMADKLDLTGWQRFLATGGIGFDKRSFNLILNSPLPSVGPPIALPLNEILKNKPELEETLRWLLPLGVRANSAEVLLSPIIRRLNSQIGGADGDATFERDFYNLMVWEDWRYRTGERMDPPDYDTVREEARKIYMLRLGFNLLSPAQPSLSSPLQPYIEIFRDLQDMYGPDKADEIFLNQYGNEFFAVTLSRTVSATGIPPTVEAQVARRAVEGLIEKYPNFGRLIIGEDSSMGEFSSAAFAYQLTHGVPGDQVGTESEREYRQLEVDTRTGRITEVDRRIGWSEYLRAMDSIDLERRNRGLPNLRVREARDLANLKRALTEALAEKYPAWWDDFNERDDLRWTRDLSSLRDIAFEPTMDDRPDLLGVRDYFQARDAVIAELNRRKQLGGASTIDAIDNQDLAQLWEALIYSIIEDNISFGPLYYRYLEGDPMTMRSSSG